MRVLGVFAKQPVPGTVKTRLARHLGRVGRSGRRRTARRHPGPRGARAGRSRHCLCAGSRARLVPARGTGSLRAGTAGGRRVGPAPARLYRGTARAGADAVAVIGTDSPTLPVEFIEQAFERLQSADLVLGPTNDGGYYLIGCGRRLPPVFEDIPWSSSGVLGETVRRLADPSWRLALLPPWYDVDTLGDWQMLCGHVTALRRAGIDPGVPQLEALM